MMFLWLEGNCTSVERRFAIPYRAFQGVIGYHSLGNPVDEAILQLERPTSDNFALRVTKSDVRLFQYFLFFFCKLGYVEPYN